MKAKHWIVFILLGAIWSSSFMWIKIAVQEVGPITLVAFRATFGLLFGIAVIFIQRVPLPRTFRDWIPLLIVGLTKVNIAILVCEHYAKVYHTWAMYFHLFQKQSVGRVGDVRPAVSRPPTTD